MSRWPARGGARRQALRHAHLGPSEASVVPAVALRREGAGLLASTTEFLRSASVAVVAHLGKGATVKNDCVLRSELN